MLRTHALSQKRTVVARKAWVLQFLFGFGFTDPQSRLPFCHCHSFVLPCRAHCSRLYAPLLTLLLYIPTGRDACVRRVQEKTVDRRPLLVVAMVPDSPLQPGTCDLDPGTYLLSSFQTAKHDLCLVGCRVTRRRALPRHAASVDCCIASPAMQMQCICKYNSKVYNSALFSSLLVFCLAILTRQPLVFIILTAVSPSLLLVHCWLAKLLRAFAFFNGAARTYRKRETGRALARILSSGPVPRLCRRREYQVCLSCGVAVLSSGHDLLDLKTGSVLKAI